MHIILGLRRHNSYMLYLQVTSGGPILGVSKEASSGSLSFATVPFVALFGLAIMAVAILA